MLYMPPDAVIEIEDIMLEKRLTNPNIAKKEFTNYAKIGREVERMAKLDFYPFKTRQRRK